MRRRGLDIDAENSLCETALQQACLRSNDLAVMWLLINKANINHVDKYASSLICIPLIFLTFYVCFSILFDCLLSAFLFISNCCASNNSRKKLTPFHMACMSGSKTTVELLLQRGANPKVMIKKKLQNRKHAKFNINKLFFMPYLWFLIFFNFFSPSIYCYIVSFRNRESRN